MSLNAADALMGIFGFKRVAGDEITLDNHPSLDDDGGSLDEGMEMSEVKNEWLEVVATLTVSFDEGDGGSAIEQVETHTLLDEGAHDLCRHSEAIAGYAVRDARIVELESQYQRDVYGLNNEGDPIGGDPAGGYANDNARLRSELAAIKAQEPVEWEVYYSDDDSFHTITLDKSLIECYSKMAYTIKPLYAAPVAKQVVMPEPDMFWDAENLEDSFACSEREMFINLADNISMNDGEIIINLVRAARLPSIEASVWVTEDSERGREVHFEYLNAASPSAKGGE